MLCSVATMLIASANTWMSAPQVHHVITCSVDGQRQSLSSKSSRRSAHDWEDLGLTVLAVFLSVLIAAIVLRKIFVATGSGSDVSMDADISSFE